MYISVKKVEKEAFEKLPPHTFLYIALMTQSKVQSTTFKVREENFL